MTNKRSLLSIIIIPIIIASVVAISVAYLFSSYQIKQKYQKDYFSKINYNSEKIYLSIKSQYKYLFTKSATSSDTFFLLKEALKEDIKRDLISDFKTSNYGGLIYDTSTKEKILLDKTPLFNANMTILKNSNLFETTINGKDIFIKKLEFKPFNWIIFITMDTNELNHEISDALMFILIYAFVFLIAVCLVVFYIFNHYIKKDISKILFHFETKILHSQYIPLDFRTSSKDIESLKNGINQAILKISQQDSMLIQQSRQAAMGEMIGNIAHQWRQPLNALGLTIQKIKMYHDEDILTSQNLEKSVDKSKMLINKMSTTIDDFRDFFKTDKLKKEFNIKKAIDEVLNLIDGSLKNKNIQIDTSNVDEDIILLGYKNELEQVLLNIINNAKDALVEHNIKNPKIEIKVLEEKENINIKIYDNAGGIHKDIINKIFEPYFTTKEQETYVKVQE